MTPTDLIKKVEGEPDHDFDDLTDDCCPVFRMIRIVCRFSCGAASAVATKLTLAKYNRERRETP